MSAVARKLGLSRQTLMR
ncbi:hypothetical protein [Mesorhizobium sp. M0659]